MYTWHKGLKVKLRSIKVEAEKSIPRFLASSCWSSLFVQAPLQPAKLTDQPKFTSTADTQNGRGVADIGKSKENNSCDKLTAIHV